MDPLSLLGGGSLPSITGGNAGPSYAEGGNVSVVSTNRNGDIVLGTKADSSIPTIFIIGLLVLGFALWKK